MQVYLGVCTHLYRPPGSERVHVGSLLTFWVGIGVSLLFCFFCVDEFEIQSWQQQLKKAFDPLRHEPVFATDVCCRTVSCCRKLVRLRLIWPRQSRCQNQMQSRFETSCVNSLHTYFLTSYLQVSAGMRLGMSCLVSGPSHILASVSFSHLTHSLGIAEEIRGGIQEVLRNQFCALAELRRNSGFAGPPILTEYNRLKFVIEVPGSDSTCLMYTNKQCTLYKSLIDYVRVYVYTYTFSYDHIIHSCDYNIVKKIRASSIDLINQIYCVLESSICTSGRFEWLSL